MHPDSFMPLYGDDLIRAVRGKPLFVKWAYWLALWHYWTHNHCRGLEDDDHSLQDICEMRNDPNWKLAKDVIFGEFFLIDQDGLWQQNRCKAEWDKTLIAYQKQCTRTAAATAARLQNMANRRNDSRNDSRNVGRNDSR